MKQIELFEKIINGEIKYCDSGVNDTMFEAYRKSQEVENISIDFNGVIWDKDILPIVECMTENRIYEFTISSNFSGIVSTLAAFEQFGFHICGTTEVNAPYTDITTGKYKKIPAIRLRG